VSKLLPTLCIAVSLLGIGCSTISTVRLQSDTVEVAPGLRPLAAVQADAISFYALFIPIPGVNLDQVVNRMLIAAAKTMGADKVAQLRFEIDPAGGVWALRKLLGYRSARASGIAVQITAPADDPQASEGPEPASMPSESPPEAAPTSP
jgi:hypothetical protein